MAIVQQRSSESAPSSTGTQTGHAGGQGSCLGAQLRGMDYRSGAALLAPGGGGNPVQLKTDKEKAEELEQRDGGHSLDRHGPDVTDDQLQDRLTTGIAPDNVVSPAPGLSTKFSSYEEYLKTRTAAVDRVKSGMRATHGLVLPLAKAVKKAQTAFDTEPSGPGKGQKSQELAAAKLALDAACKTTAPSSTTYFPVKYVRTPNVTDSVVLYGSYGVVEEHGRAIGSGFKGKDEKKAPHPKDSSKDDIDVYDSTEALDAGVTQTKSTFEVSGATKLMAPHNPGAWKACQHFPTVDTVGISV